MKDEEYPDERKIIDNLILPSCMIDYHVFVPMDHGGSDAVPSGEF